MKVILPVPAVIVSKLNNVKGSEVYECSSCDLKLDRDIGGSRNILIKNLTLPSVDARGQVCVNARS